LGPAREASPHMSDRIELSSGFSAPAPSRAPRGPLFRRPTEAASRVPWRPFGVAVAAVAAFALIGRLLGSGFGPAAPFVAMAALAAFAGWRVGHAAEETARAVAARQETERRLQASQAELAHVARLASLGDMSLAHELSQPMAAAANYVQAAVRMLEEDAADRSQVAAALQRAADHTLRAGEMIRRLKAFAARGETHATAQDLAGLLQEAAALAALGEAGRGAEVSIDIDPRAATVWADRVQLQQVVMNLLRNAFEAMQGQPRREVRLAARWTPDGCIEVSVTDQGCGISSAAAARLFEPFLSTKPSGMGVGLSISRAIVEAHGGRIWAEPGPAGGAVFRFTLPVAAPATA